MNIKEMKKQFQDATEPSKMADGRLSTIQSVAGIRVRSTPLTVTHCGIESKEVIRRQ